MTACKYKNSSCASMLTGIYIFYLSLQKSHFDLTNPFHQIHLRTISMNMGHCHQNRQLMWNEVNSRSACLHIPWASPKLWQEALGWGGGGRKGIYEWLTPSTVHSLGWLCLRPAHRRQTVFRSLDYKDPHFPLGYDTQLPKTDRKSMLQEETDEAHPWIWGFPLQMCLFCCNWTQTSWCRPWQKDDIFVCFSPTAKTTVEKHKKNMSKVQIFYFFYFIKLAVCNLKVILPLKPTKKLQEPLQLAVCLRQHAKTDTGWDVANE